MSKCMFLVLSVTCLLLVILAAHSAPVDKTEHLRVITP